MNSYNFKLTDKKFVNDINSEVFEFEHKKTKSKLIYIKNDDANKVFTIGFKTIPDDSTGVAHIIEHSVLNGSDKYPVKEPFVELMKSSLNTFLNAMTFSEKTLYPVASQNNKDFMNLISVYLDAVFEPNITKIKEIFMQEGWHYELENKEDKLSLNGVVYSEMKGALSSPLEVMEESINQSLFDNCYKYNSGGDPDVIPSLTYEKFLEFYHKFYHPSNAMIILYGNCKVEEIMKFIDENYFNKFDYSEIDSSIKFTDPFSEEKKEKFTYSINDEDDIKGKTFFSKNYVVSTATDEETCFAMNVLKNVLVDSESSLIKKKLLENNLCGDVCVSYHNFKLQPTFNIIVQNTDEENIEQINKIIESTISDLAFNGIDKKFLEACITNTVFKFKQEISNNSLKGIDLSINLFNRWSFIDNPVEVLYYEDRIKKMYAMLENNGFEKLLERYFVNNNHKSSVTLIPEKGLARKKAEALSKKLQEYKDSLNDSELNQIVNECKSLKKRQITPDTEEDLSTMPVLDLCDIDKNSIKRNVNEEKTDKYALLHYEKFTNDLLYNQILFDASNLNKEEMYYAGLLSQILGKISTRNYNLDNLLNETMINAGEISFRNAAFLDTQDINNAFKHFKVTMKMSTSKIDKAIELLDEILFNSELNDFARIKQILNMTITYMQSRFVVAGHNYSIIRLLSKFDTSYYYLEKTTGYSFYNFVKNLYDNFDNMKDNISKNLSNVLHKLLNTNNLIITTTCTKQQKDEFKKRISFITEKLDSTIYPCVFDNFEYNNDKEAFSIASNVQYVGMGYNFKKLGYNFDGSMKVIETLLSTDYLWNNVRVLGGAYGCLMKLKKEGTLVFVSYRDPNLDKTVENYRNIVKFLDETHLDKTNLTKYIIGTIKDLDQPLSVEDEGNAAFNKYISHDTYENQQYIREQILNTKSEDINRFKDLFKCVFDKNIYNVFGNSEAIKHSKLDFDKTINI